MKGLKTTKERVIKAAQVSCEIKSASVELFPETFESEWVDVTTECDLLFDTRHGNHIRVEHQGQWLMEIGLNAPPSLYGNSICPMESIGYRVERVRNSCSGWDKFRIMKWVSQT